MIGVQEICKCGSMFRLVHSMPKILQALSVRGLSHQKHLLHSKLHYLLRSLGFYLTYKIRTWAPMILIFRYWSRLQKWIDLTFWQQVIWLTYITVLLRQSLITLWQVVIWVLGTCSAVERSLAQRNPNMDRCLSFAGREKNLSSFQQVKRGSSSSMVTRLFLEEFAKERAIQLVLVIVKVLSYLQLTTNSFLEIRKKRLKVSQNQSTDVSKKYQ